MYTNVHYNAFITRLTTLLLQLRVVFLVEEGSIAMDKVNYETHIISAFEMLRFVPSKSFFRSFSKKW